ncbi:MAG TPA: discoidin domain-containing protein [Nitrospirales bacterium]|nr:discoidin domain-containing protein [Nitrospirales bacterium]
MRGLSWTSCCLVAGVTYLSMAICAAGEKIIASDFRLLDGFERVGEWQAYATEGSEASVETAGGVTGNGLKLSYELRTAGGANAHRALPLDLSNNFEIAFKLRGHAPQATFEVRLVDDSGANVWWKQFRDYEFHDDWTTIRIRRSDIHFAWGPIKDHNLKTIARLEFVILGARGDKGTVEFDTLEMRTLPEPPAIVPPLAVTADGVPVPAAVDGNPETAWTTDKPTELTLDLGYVRDIGGLTMRWAAGQMPEVSEVAISEDGAGWTIPDWKLGTGPSSPGTIGYLRTADAFGRYVRLSLNPASGGRTGLIEARVEPPEFGQDDNRFLFSLARETEKGFYPRSFLAEQIYWTIVGPPQGGRLALLSEDGAMEPGPGAFSIEPFLVEKGSVRSWADGSHHHSLLDEYLSLPRVRRTHDGFSLEISAHRPPVPAGREGGADGHARDVVTRYRVTNTGMIRRTLTLALAIRPMQVNPPTQTLNLVGGASRIEQISWDGAAFQVNGDWSVYPALKPDHVSLSGFERAGFPHVQDYGASTDSQRMVAPEGFGSGVMSFHVDLKPGESRDVTVVTVLGAGNGRTPDLHREAIDVGEMAAADEWREILNRVDISGPPESMPMLNTLKTALAHMMMTREGPGLRPGPRNYARSWIRDGAMMGEGFLRLGHNEPAVEFARWYAPYQFSSGKVPCCVDKRGADPVVENDSHGELIFLIVDIYRYTGDRAFAEMMWPHVDKAAAALDTLRLSERTEHNRQDDRKAFYGLLPASVSHEGYLDRPAYSFWDNFWGLKGLNDAAFLAEELGHSDRAAEIRADAAEFAADIRASVSLLGEELGHVPGAADRKDFDPTSTTIALSPTGAAAALPRELLITTFEKAWSEFVSRRDDQKAWEVYTPYEFRQVSAFVRLGEVERAHALLDFYMHDRRPTAWNQWSEVIGRHERVPRFIGDMPHTWVGSDFIRAVLDLFVYADAETGTLVIGAGLPRSWLQDEGIRVRGLRTPYGEVSYTARDEGGQVRVDLEGSTIPPGGFVFPSSLKKDLRVTFNGDPVNVQATFP